jgi:hypothetical protein
MECESDGVCRKLVASLETLPEVSADVEPDLRAGIGILRRLFSSSRWLFVTSRRLSIPKVESDVRYWEIDPEAAFCRWCVRFSDTESLQH